MTDPAADRKAVHTDMQTYTYRLTTFPDSRRQPYMLAWIASSSGARRHEVDDHQDLPRY
jgi:hypothetical protein